MVDFQYRNLWHCYFYLLELVDRYILIMILYTVQESILFQVAQIKVRKEQWQISVIARQEGVHGMCLITIWFYPSTLLIMNT